MTGAGGDTGRGVRAAARGLRTWRKLLGMVLAAALTGPPRSMYKDDFEDERWMQIVEREVWLLLAKINEATKAWERTLRKNSKN